MKQQLIPLVQELGWYIPLYLTVVRAGFTNPAEGYIERELNLNEELVTNPSNTHLFPVQTDLLVKHNIYRQDALIVDTDLIPSHGDIVIAKIYDEIDVKQYITINDERYLFPKDDRGSYYKLGAKKWIRILGVSTYLLRPLYNGGIVDIQTSELDLNKLLIKNKPSTFFVRARGNSMMPTIEEDDILIVDFSAEPKNNCIVIASINGHLTVKRLSIREDKSYVLVPDNKNYDTIIPSEEGEYNITGIVTYVIRKMD